MAKRSLRASPAGIRIAKQQFASKGWNQEYLATEVGIKTRQPVWRFFAGLPIERYTFFEICTRLDLNWREIALDPPLESSLEINQSSEQSENYWESLKLDALVQKVRSLRQEKVAYQCGILKLLDISRPVSIEHIYIDINILENIASEQWLDFSSLDHLTAEDADRIGLGKIVEAQIPGMQAVEKYSHVRVLGKPGSGKTTFLKHLAIQCNHGTFADRKVPIFIRLIEFVESFRNNTQVNLLDYINQEFASSNISYPLVANKLLQQGRILLMLDGMDEVCHEKEQDIVTEIRNFVEKYYKNQFVVSCRTSAPKMSLRGFTDVEIAPFTQAQINTFSSKWFVEFSKTNAEDGLARSLAFIQELELTKNWRYRRLITTPLFLHLACSIFNPQEKFPLKQAEFYKQGMDLLLGKWDEANGVERDQIYRGLLLPQKIKLLSQIASATFDQGHYFFKQGEIEQYIGVFLQNLPDASTDLEEIQQSSGAVLRAIESQHGLLAERARGIFSFSYLALQEFFTAREIVARHNLQTLGKSLNGLVKHINDPQWREIFLLTSSMLRSADGLMELMKQQIDALVAQDPYLQEFLSWANQKTINTSPKTKPAIQRAFYLALTTPHIAPHFALACTLDQGAYLDAALNDILQSCLVHESNDFSYVHACSDSLSNILSAVVDLGFYKVLQQLRDQLPNDDHNKISFDNWCNHNYEDWVKRLQEAIYVHRGISNHWKFSPEQQQILHGYFAANQLLLDCLNSNCEITPKIREEIEKSLLLPLTELEIREWD